jgi:hypothetical protein
MFLITIILLSVFTGILTTFCFIIDGADKKSASLKKEIKHIEEQLDLDAKILKELNRFKDHVEPK